VLSLKPLCKLFVQNTKEVLDNTILLIETESQFKLVYVVRSKCQQLFKFFFAIKARRKKQINEIFFCS